MKNSLNDVNNYLFEQLERLTDDEELEEKGSLDRELKRAKAISGLCQTIVSNAKLVLDAKKYADEIGVNDEKEVLMLKENNEK